MVEINEWWSMELEKKPDFDECMKRVNAWYEMEIIDRPPIRFTAHNHDFKHIDALEGRNWSSFRQRWWDTEYQLDLFEYLLDKSTFNAETFPVFWPNLGPEVYTAFFGAELEYQDVTSYSIPMIKDWDQLDGLKPDLNNPYFKKIEELTFAALDRCEGKFIVGYTDLHPGMDCAAAFRDPGQLCLDTILDIENVKKIVDISSRDFQMIYDHFHAILRGKKQPSVTWMGIPSFGKMHIPSCDFSSLISPEQFNELALPGIIEEVKPMTHNIFHLDGKGVAKNLDPLLNISEIQAIQWVQGAGNDSPIMQWVPLIKKIQAANKSVVVDLMPQELEEFMGEVSPEGIYLCINADTTIQSDIIKRVEKWV